MIKQIALEACETVLYDAGVTDDIQKAEVFYKNNFIAERKGVCDRRLCKQPMSTFSELFGIGTKHDRAHTRDSEFVEAAENEFENELLGAVATGTLRHTIEV